MIDLTADYKRAFDRMTTPQWRRVKALGAPHFIGIIRATPDSKTTWQPDDAGRPYMLFPIWDEYVTGIDAIARTLDGDINLIDLAIWRPDEPATILLRTGSVFALDESEIDGWLLPDRLHIKSDPLAYWRDGALGTVIIDWHAARPYLLWHDHIICDDLATAELVEHHTEAARRALTPSRPSIGIIEAATATPAP